MAQMSLQIGKSAVRFYLREPAHPKAPISEKLIVDKGKFLRLRDEKLLRFSFYSSMEGYPDLARKLFCCVCTH